MADIGGKAKWIGKISKVSDVEVPKGICIGTEYFDCFLKNHPKNNTIFKLKQESIEKPICARKNLSVIRDIIIKSKLDDEFVYNIVSDLQSLGINISQGIVVRSSSQCEDSIKKSYAGVFSSTVDITDVEKMRAAILETWASQFSEISYIYDLESVNSSMAVIIQKMVYSDSYGVLFSKAPNNERCMLIEEGSRVSQIVDGYESTHTYFVERLSGKIINEDKNNSKYCKLIQVVCALENTFGMYCDIEWAIDNEKTYIIQCRPQTTYDNNFEYKLISNDDIETCERTYIGACEKYLNKFMGKQYLFRSEVLKNGFNVYKQYFMIINNPEKLSEAVEEYKSIFKNVKFVIIEFGEKSKTKTCKLDALYEVLSEELEMNKQVLYCRIGELINAEKAGYVSVNDSGECLVEYTKARMSGIQSGRIEPIKALIKDGRAVYISRPKISTIDIIDENTGKSITIKNVSDEYPYLRDDEILDLEKFTNSMSKEFKNASFEWYISAGKFYGKDISIETERLYYDENSKNVISKGNAMGKAFIIKDLVMLDEISEKYNLSLYAHDTGDYDVINDENVLKIMEELKSLDKPIVFAERPTNGILSFADYISGCVFKYGSVLSHVGICMREKKLPACIDAGLFDKVISTKTLVEIIDGKAKIVDD